MLLELGLAVVLAKWVAGAASAGTLGYSGWKVTSWIHSRLAEAGDEDITRQLVVEGDARLASLMASCMAEGLTDEQAAENTYRITKGRVGRKLVHIVNELKSEIGEAAWFDHSLVNRLAVSERVKRRLRAIPNMRKDQIVSISLLITAAVMTPSAEELANLGTLEGSHAKAAHRQVLRMAGARPKLWQVMLGQVTWTHWMFGTYGASASDARSRIDFGEFTPGDVQDRGGPQPGPALPEPQR